MDSYSGFSDEQLIVLLKEGKQLAFAEIYNRYKSQLLLHAYRFLQDREEAHDVVQEMFAVVWAKRDVLDIRGDLDSYLYVAIKNRILKYIAHQKVIDKYMQSLDGYVEASELANDELLIGKQLKRIIEEEIAQLPQKMREIFELSRMEGLSHRQIAQQLGISENTVKAQVQNASKILRPKIKLGITFFLGF
jgi:RNA polymerase sigma-70 factor (ECF subfamily)